MRSFNASAACRNRNDRQRLIGRYSDFVPIDLYRIQSGEKVRLREYERQMARGLASFDLRLDHEGDGLVHPATGD